MCPVGSMGGGESWMLKIAANSGVWDFQRTHAKNLAEDSELQVCFARMNYDLSLFGFFYSLF